jgi:hypothetical protein
VINEQIFALVNDISRIDEFLDLHGQMKDFSVETTSNRLADVKHRVNTGQITPNHDGVNHIYKISCGAGKHSIKEPVLKNAI